ncbi:MAG TPA: hypothetical protein VFK13_13150 [Gemmatimonadaceae bacterium]|nr:hypothetical protein [Gemmatimonadaceae bacterium]
MDTVKDDAEVLRLGLVTGLVRRDAVVVWADGLVAANRGREIPVLLDLSLGARKSVAELVSLLGEIPGTARPANVGRRLAREIYRGLRDGRIGVQSAARSMYGIMRDGYSPDDEFEMMAYTADDGVDLALAGVYGTLAELSRDVLEFPQRYDDADELPVPSAS